MATLPCPLCGQAVADYAEEHQLERCPHCAGSLDIAYRYRLVSHRGPISGGVLYEALDVGFDETVAVLFAADPNDEVETARFVDGNRLFAELGGGRGLVRVRELGGRGEPRPYVVTDWIADGTLESRIKAAGPLDNPTLLEATGDLLNGLSKAHRSMPSIVHNHIHPGKIGFVGDDEIAMFGFEWAQQVFEQDSTLADTFVADIDDAGVSKRAIDLQRLGQSLYYAATGEWIAELSVAQQRERARSRLSEPMAMLLDRMLGAGAGGYRTAVDAVMDFDTLLRGERSHWRPRQLPKDAARNDILSSAWTTASLTNTDVADAAYEVDTPYAPAMTQRPVDDSRVLGLHDLEEIDDDDIDDIDDDDSYEYESAALIDDQPIAQQVYTPPAPALPSAPLEHRAEAFSAAAAQRLRQAQAQAQKASGEKARKLIGVLVFLGIGVAMFVANVAENSNDYEQPMPKLQVPITVEPIPAPERFEPEPVVEPATALRLSGTFRYAGEVNGPQDLSGFAIGDPCEIWVEPNDSSLNCRWYIDCGTPRRRIYGGGEVGFSTCAVDDDGFPTSAKDDEDDASDGAFVADLDGPVPMVMVLDRWLLPPTRVAIQITEVGPHPGPIPEVRQRRRVPREAVQARINADDWPTFPGDPAN